jgi:hypothetical protein
MIETIKLQPISENNISSFFTFEGANIHDQSGLNTIKAKGLN